MLKSVLLQFEIPLRVQNSSPPKGIQTAERVEDPNLVFLKEREFKSVQQ